MAVGNCILSKHSDFCLLCKRLPEGGMTRHFYISAGDANVPGTCGFKLHLFSVSENYEEDAPSYFLF